MRSERDHTHLMLVETSQQRASRVERIKGDIATGRYSVASLDVADAIVAFFTRDPDLTADHGETSGAC